MVDAAKERKLRFAVEDPDAPENWPRVWFIWRGNALMAERQGPRVLPEALPRHAHERRSREESRKDASTTSSGASQRPQGKLDLVVDLNFRMDTSALYSDIVLPAATWYEKDDLNSTDMHSFIHPLQAAVPPCWESKSDWEIFEALAKQVHRAGARGTCPSRCRTSSRSPLAHDTPAEIAQPGSRDWHAGECEPIPGKTMPGLAVVDARLRAPARALHRASGPLARASGLGAHGLTYADRRRLRRARWATARRVACGRQDAIPSCRDGRARLRTSSCASRTGPTASWPARAYHEHGEEDRAAARAISPRRTRGVRTTFKDLQAQPRRLLNSPMLDRAHRTTAAPTRRSRYNVERLVPWRTLTGRQHLYLDHPGYLAVGEHLPTYKPKPQPVRVRRSAT